MKHLNMHIEIEEYCDSETGLKTYRYYMCDGPDGIDDSSGDCSSLEECFEKIIEDRSNTSLLYGESQIDQQFRSKIYRDLQL